MSGLVEISGLEPPTPTLSGWCSNQLSYISICLIVLRDTDLHLISPAAMAFAPCGARLSRGCSDQLSYISSKSGGGKEIRTLDPLLAGQVLYQLSYTPTVVATAFADSLYNISNAETLVKRFSPTFVKLHFDVACGAEVLS